MSTYTFFFLNYVYFVRYYDACSNLLVSAIGAGDAGAFESVLKTNNLFRICTENKQFVPYILQTHTY